MRLVKHLLRPVSERLLASPRFAEQLLGLPLVGDYISRLALEVLNQPLLAKAADARARTRPDDGLTFEMYAKAAMARRLYKSADQLYRRAENGYSLSKAGLASHIEALRRVDLDRALERGGAAIAADPDDGRLLFAHAINLWVAGQSQRALSAARRALRLKPKDVRIAHFITTVEDQLPHYGSAEGACAEGRGECREAKLGRDDVVIGVLDYKSPDYTQSSNNIGDYIQSLALLRILARFVTSRWKLPSDDLARVMADLRTTSSAPVASSRDPPVALVTVDRDAPTMAAARHRDHTIWLPTFGWFCHPPFGAAPPLPFPDNVRPFFISFHLNKPYLLTAEAIAYLKRFEPVGCRDWSTVYWLLNAGVEAFFSGCITLTLALPGKRPAGQTVYAVDAPKGWRPVEDVQVERIEHKDASIRSAGFTDNLVAAIGLLDRYRSARRVITSRLHCYLPCAALGVPVDFIPRSQADRRYDGLINLSRADQLAIKRGIEDKIVRILAAILDRRPEREIYAAWRAACVADVALARARLAETPSPLADRPAASLPAPAALRPQRLDVALAFDSNLLRYVPTVINSMLRNSSRPIRFHLQTRGVEARQIAMLGRQFADVELRHLPMDGWLANIPVTLLQHTTIATMDRLFLPELLPDVDRLVYTDIDVIVLGDIAELHDIAPSSRGIAARPSIDPEFLRQVNTIENLARKQPAERAARVRRLGAREVDLLARSFNAGVLVLSLARLRELGLAEAAIELVREFGMNDQEALNIFSRGDFSELPAAWNTFAYREVREGAKLIHWAGRVKPWARRHVWAQSEWKRYYMPLASPATESIAPAVAATRTA
jgi:lipopolysaccharide biosynthesis glycosyltransferase/tetratricopeptide (TPR) repeat protein